MTPSELNEILCVGGLSVHMYPKGILLKLLMWLPRNALLNILLFCYLSLPIAIQSIITWEFFIILKNGLYHVKAHRISFHLVYIKA